MSFTLISRIGENPVSLDQVKQQSRITHNAEDSLLLDNLKSAIEFSENHTQKLIHLSNVISYFDDDCILLNRPVRAITAIKYSDSDGNEQSHTSYKTKQSHDYGLTVELINMPENQRAWIEYVSGYGDYTVTGTELKVINTQVREIPAVITRAISLLTGHYYINRESITDFQKHELTQGVFSHLNYEKSYS